MGTARRSRSAAASTRRVRSRRGRAGFRGPETTFLSTPTGAARARTRQAGALRWVLSAYLRRRSVRARVPCALHQTQTRRCVSIVLTTPSSSSSSSSSCFPPRPFTSRSLPPSLHLLLSSPSSSRHPFIPFFRRCTGHGGIRNGHDIFGDDREFVVGLPCHRHHRQRVGVGFEQLRRQCPLGEFSFIYRYILRANLAHSLTRSP